MIEPATLFAFLSGVVVGLIVAPFAAFFGLRALYRWIDHRPNDSFDRMMRGES